MLRPTRIRFFQSSSHHVISSSSPRLPVRNRLLNAHATCGLSSSSIVISRPATACSHGTPFVGTHISSGRSIIVRRAFSVLGSRKVGEKSSDQAEPPQRPKLREQLREKLKAVQTHENIYTLPNILTFSRLIAAPVIGYLVLHDQHLWAVGLFAYAGITDLLDGWIARKWNLQTVVGSVVDPMADKALMTILVGCLAVNGALPLPIATLIFGRDASLALAAIYYRWASLPVPKTFTRYWDFSLPSASVHPTTVSKFNTFLQLLLIGYTLTLPLLPPPDTIASTAAALEGVTNIVGGASNSWDGFTRLFQGTVAATTIWSGMEYAFNRSAVKIMGDDEVLKGKQGFRGRAIIGSSFAACIALAAWFWIENPIEQRKKAKIAAENGTEDAA